MPIFSKRELEGYVCIDHTDSPGFTIAEARAAGRSAVADLLGAGTKFEAPTYFCRHCERTVVMRPDRSRERCWCWSCDRFICDDCGVEAKLPGYVHKTYQQKCDEWLKAVMKRSVLIA